MYKDGKRGEAEEKKRVVLCYQEQKNSSRERESWLEDCMRAQERLVSCGQALLPHRGIIVCRAGDTCQPLHLEQ